MNVFVNIVSAMGIINLSLGASAPEIASQIVKRNDASEFLDEFGKLSSLEEQRLLLSVAAELTSEGKLRTQVLNYLFSNLELPENDTDRIRHLRPFITYYAHTVMNPSSVNLKPRKRSIMVDSTIRGKVFNITQGIIGFAESETAYWESSPSMMLKRVETLLGTHDSPTNVISEEIIECLGIIENARVQLGGESTVDSSEIPVEVPPNTSAKPSLRDVSVPQRPPPADENTPSRKWLLMLGGCALLGGLVLILVTKRRAS